jgi:hypothetical protein
MHPIVDEKCMLQVRVLAVNQPDRRLSGVAARRSAATGRTEAFGTLLN